MEYTFSSAITRGGNALTPEKIIITDKFVTWKKRNKYLIGVDRITIEREKISSIEIDQKIWGAKIIITSLGGGKIIGSNFTGSDAKEIKNILENIEE